MTLIGWLLGSVHKLQVRCVSDYGPPIGTSTYSYLGDSLVAGFVAGLVPISGDALVVAGLVAGLVRFLLVAGRSVEETDGDGILSAPVIFILHHMSYASFSASVSVLGKT